MACCSNSPPPTPFFLAPRPRWCRGRPVLSHRFGMVTSERCWWSRNRPSPSPSPLLLQPRPRLSMTARGEGFRFSCDARVVHRCGISGRRGRKASFVFCYMDDSSGVRATGGESSDATGSTGLQLYSQIERLITETARQSQDGWSSGDWIEIEDLVTKQMIGIGCEAVGLYVFQPQEKSALQSIASPTLDKRLDEIHLWHSRLGHLSFRDEVAQAIQAFCNMVRTQVSKTVKTFRFDNAHEYYGHSLDAFLEDMENYIINRMPSTTLANRFLDVFCFIHSLGLGATKLDHRAVRRVFSLAIPLLKRDIVAMILLDIVSLFGAWVLKPKSTKPTSVIHFIGGIFVGAAPQLTYRLFLERLAEKGILVIATPFASGFDHFSIADQVQFKFDRCLRSLQDTANDLPTFGIGHSLGSVIHLLIGSRYAVQRNGNILMAFNNKEASLAIPLFSPVIVPVAQSFGPFLSQITSSPAILRGAEMALKQLENLSPPIMRQVLPLIEQLPPLYMDLVKGREDFSPKPEETRRLIKSYYGVSRNLLIKFRDDTIDETPTLAQVLSSESAISSQLDMSIRSVPGDHGLPLQQVLPDVPPAMAEAVNRGGEFLASLTVGTPWETVAKEVGNTLGADSSILRAQISQDVEALVDLITSWMVSNSGPRLLGR